MFVLLYTVINWMAWVYWAVIIVCTLLCLSLYFRNKKQMHDNLYCTFSNKYVGKLQAGICSV